MRTSTETTSDLRIGTLAERTGSTAPTIRYYEDLGLLRRGRRQPGGQRRYGEDDVHTAGERCESACNGGPGSACVPLTELTRVAVAPTRRAR